MSDFTGAWLLPPSELKLAPGEVHVWRVGLNCSPSKLESYRQILNEDELNRAARFYFERDRRRFVVGRAVLRNILGLYLKETPASLKFEYGAQGKPALAAGLKTGDNCLEFNLSNSNELALLAVTYNYRIGIDIEYPKENVAISELVKRFFAPQEVIAFRNLPPGQQPEAFYNAWTRKEAYLKACGGGLSIGLDRVEVSFVPGQPARIVGIGDNRQEAARWSLEVLYPGTGYQAALAVEASNYKLKLWKLTSDWLLQASTNAINVTEPQL